MSVESLRGVLDRFEEASSVSGTYKPAERIAIALPDGDVGAVSDANFVDWLLHHSEPAPYGEGTVTKLDPKVRNAQRLVARDKAVVHGFDASAVLAEVEAVLSPGAHLDATLTDVIAYPKGGKFERHKDTPRAKNLIGTLVVGLPIKHTGGAFHVDDGRDAKVYDWSKTPSDVLPWVALFSDVDHEIKPVQSGTRVTLVYALHRSDRPRTDAAWTKRNEALRAACKDIKPPTGWPLMIACGRHAIAEPDTPQPQGIETLRGTDREIAEALVAAGYNVGVRACIAGVPNYDLPADMPRNELPVTQYLFSVTRLNSVPPASVIEALADEGGYEIEDYMHDTIPMDQWLVRKNAAATLILEAGQWGDPGSLGNEGYDALLYTLAALEVDKSKPVAKKTAKKPAAKKSVAKKPAAKKSTAKKTAAKKKR
jgi:hypothetical protein